MQTEVPTTAASSSPPPSFFSFAFNSLFSVTTFCDARRGRTQYSTAIATNNHSSACTWKASNVRMCFERKRSAVGLMDMPPVRHFDKSTRLLRFNSSRDRNSRLA